MLSYFSNGLIHVPHSRLQLASIYLLGKYTFVLRIILSIFVYNLIVYNLNNTGG